MNDLVTLDLRLFKYYFWGQDRLIEEIEKERGERWDLNYIVTDFE